MRDYEYISDIDKYKTADVFTVGNIYIVGTWIGPCTNKNSQMVWFNDLNIRNKTASRSFKHLYENDIVVIEITRENDPEYFL